MLVTAALPVETIALFDGAVNGTEDMRSENRSNGFVSTAIELM